MGSRKHMKWKKIKSNSFVVSDKELSTPAQKETKKQSSEEKAASPYAISILGVLHKN